MVLCLRIKSPIITYMPPPSASARLQDTVLFSNSMCHALAYIAPPSTPALLPIKLLRRIVTSPPDRRSAPPLASALFSGSALISAAAHPAGTSSPKVVWSIKSVLTSMSSVQPRSLGTLEKNAKAPPSDPEVLPTKTLFRMMTLVLEVAIAPPSRLASLSSSRLFVTVNEPPSASIAPP